MALSYEFAQANDNYQFFEGGFYQLALIYPKIKYSRGSLDYRIFTEWRKNKYYKMDDFFYTLENKNIRVFKVIKNHTSPLYFSIKQANKTYNKSLSEDQLTSIRKNSQNYQEVKKYDGNREYNQGDTVYRNSNKTNVAAVKVYRITRHLPNMKDADASTEIMTNNIKLVAETSSSSNLRAILGAVAIEQQFKLICKKQIETIQTNDEEVTIGHVETLFRFKRSIVIDSDYKWTLSKRFTFNIRNVERGGTDGLKIGEYKLLNIANMEYIKLPDVGLHIGSQIEMSSRNSKNIPLLFLQPVTMIAPFQGAGVYGSLAVMALDVVLSRLAFIMNLDEIFVAGASFTMGHRRGGVLEGGNHGAGILSGKSQIGNSGISANTNLIYGPPIKHYIYP